MLGQDLGFFPTTPSNVTFAYTVHGIPSPQPFSAQIFGNTHFGAGNFGQWWGVAAGGTPTYNYEWYINYAGPSGYWSHVGSGNTYSQIVDYPIWLKLVAIDSQSPVQNSTEVVLQIHVNTCGNPPCPMPKALLEAIPTEFRLNAAYPNPFNPTTTIKYDLPELGKVRIMVHDILGRTVATLVDSEMPAGFHSAVLDADHLTSGIFIVTIEATGTSGATYRTNQKITLIK